MVNSGEVATRSREVAKLDDNDEAELMVVVNRGETDRRHHHPNLRCCPKLPSACLRGIGGRTTRVKT